MTINESSITPLISTDKSNIIEVTFTEEDKVTKRISSSNSEVDKVDVIDIANSRFV